MKRWIGGLVLILIGMMTVWAADNDTDAAKKTRDERLMVKVTMDWKDQPIGDVLKYLVGKIDEAGKGKIELKFGTGVSMNSKKTYSAKDKTVADVLDGVLGEDLGYVVISKKGDKTDGGLMITKGSERGEAMAAKDKPGKGDKSKDKPKPEPKDKPDPKDKPKPEPKPKDPPSADAKEKDAAQKLDLIKMLIDSGKKEKAKERLEELIKAFPDSKAAVEAKELLEKLK